MWSHAGMICTGDRCSHMGVTINETEISCGGRESAELAEKVF